MEEADDAMRNYTSHSAKERLEIAFYLTSIAYRFDIEHPPRVNKTLFVLDSMRNDVWYFKNLEETPLLFSKSRSVSILHFPVSVSFYRYLMNG